MLVLGRKIGEGIVINGNIHVVIVEASRGRVRMGIDAPASVRVVREELLDRDRANANGAPALESLPEPVAV